MNELEKHFRRRIVTVTVANSVPDKRYRVFVTLIRADRPRYWNFLCNNCGAKIVELQNLEVLADDDFYDPQNINNTGIGKHCKGMTKDDLPCQYSYFFHVQ